MSSPDQEVQTITIDEYFKMCADSIDGDFLKKGIERSIQENSDTDIELKKHNIQACVVTYLDNDTLCINPVSWGRTSWRTSGPAPRPPGPCRARFIRSQFYFLFISISQNTP